MARTRQPQVPARIDWSNPITRGLVAAWLPSIGSSVVWEAITSSLDATSGTVGFTGSQHGKGLSLTAASNYVNGGTRAANAVTTQEISVMAIIRPAVLTRGDLVTRWLTGGNAGDQFNLLYGLTSGKPAFYVTTGGSTQNSGASSIAMAVGNTYVVGGAASIAQSVSSVWVNGVLGSTGPVPASINVTPSTVYRIGDNANGDGNFNGDFFGAAVWNRYLLASEWAALAVNPHQLFAPSRRVWVQLGPAAGGGEVTGTATITPSPQTLTGAGTVAVAGTLNKTPAAQTVATAATVAIAGTLTITPAAQTVSATGTVTSGVVGTASITPAAQTVTASGTVPIAATATITPSAQTLAGASTVTGGTVTGTAAITPAAQTVTASATVSGGVVTGTANVFVSAQTLVAAANIIVLGTATITPAAQTLLGLEAGALPEEIPESSRTWLATTPRLGPEVIDGSPPRIGSASARRNRPRLG
jgi:hypothetical protein